MEPLNIDIVGPGAWYLIHLMASQAKTDEEIRSVHYIFKVIGKTFFCLTCREHFARNMKAFPPPTVNQFNELFIWTVEMHNKVNRVNEKPEVSYRDALNFYVGPDATCKGDCGSKSKQMGVSERILSTLSSGNHDRFETTKKYRL